MAQSFEAMIAAAVAEKLASDPAMLAFALQRNGFVAPSAPASVGVTPPAIVAAGVETVDGILAHVASSGKGARITGSEDWFNVAKGTAPLFEGLAAGTPVSMTLNDKGRVVAVEAASAAPQARQPKAAKVAAPAVAVAQPAAPAAPATLPSRVVDADGTWACALCSGPLHGKEAGETTARNCAIRQYQNATGLKVSMLEPGSFAAFAEWLANTRVVVYAHTKGGRALISTGKPKPPTPPTPPTTGGPAPRKGTGSSKAQASSKGAAKAAPTAPARVTKAADKAILAAGKKMLADSKVDPLDRRGTYTGLFVKHASKNRALVNIVSADMPRAKSHGDWLEAELPQVVEAMLPAKQNDRVQFVLQGAGASERIVGFKILGTVEKETGHRAGVQTSGKQQAPAPKKQGTDPKVKAARTAKRAEAHAERDAGDVALDAKLAAASEKNVKAARARNASAVKPAAKNALVTEQDGSIAVAGRAKKRTSKKQPIFPCSNTTQHRTTCRGRCVE